MNGHSIVHPFGEAIQECRFIGAWRAAPNQVVGREGWVWWINRGFKKIVSLWRFCGCCKHYRTWKNNFTGNSGFDNWDYFIHDKNKLRITNYEWKNLASLIFDSRIENESKIGVSQLTRRVSVAAAVAVAVAGILKHWAFKKLIYFTTLVEKPYPLKN